MGNQNKYFLVFLSVLFVTGYAAGAIAEAFKISDTGVPQISFPYEVSVGGQVKKYNHLVSVENICISKDGLYYRTKNPEWICTKSIEVKKICRMGEVEYCGNLPKVQKRRSPSEYLKSEQVCMARDAQYLLVKRLEQFKTSCTKYRLRSQGEIFEIDCIEITKERFPGPVRFEFVRNIGRNGDSTGLQSVRDSLLIPDCP
jgi:hypothetical protein